MARGPLNVLMTPVGSSGDVHPYIGLGRELARRGHEVVVITGEPFRGPVTRAGLRFESVWSAEEYDAGTKHPDLWHPRRALPLVLRVVAAHLRPTLRALEVAFRPGRTLLVGHTLGFAARCFEEASGVPSATVHLAPSVFRSDFAQPAHRPGGDFSSLPRPAKRALWWLVDRFMIDRHLLPALNPFRAELGLPPVSRPFRSWIHSPHRVVALFPEWFGPPQPDWPAALRFAGFPLYDEAEQHAPDPGLLAWLAAGEAPVLFAAGSAHRQADRFFREAAGAAALLGRRALLVTRYPEQLPSPLPPGVRHEAYAPFSRVFPRCAAVVHHGGVGTVAQAFAAGVPQLAVPLAHDQPDNATRLSRLGVGSFLLPRRFRAARVAKELRRLIADPRVAEACRARAATMDGPRAIRLAADLLEEAATA